MRVSPGKEAGYLLVAVVASVAALIPLGDFGFVLDARLRYVAVGVGSLWVLARLGMVLKAWARWAGWTGSPAWVIEAADLPLEERLGGRLPRVLSRFLPARDRGILLGRGFQWTPQHTQELETFMRDGARPLPTGAGERGGYPALHAVGRAQERPLVLPFSELVGHVLIGGTTRSGKTRLLEVVVCEAIRAPGTVVVIDPKGDVELLMRAASQARRTGTGVPRSSARRFLRCRRPLTRCRCAADDDGAGGAGAGLDAGRRRNGSGSRSSPSTRWLLSSGWGRRRRRWARSGRSRG